MIELVQMYESQLFEFFGIIQMVSAQKHVHNKIIQTTHEQHNLFL